MAIAALMGVGTAVKGEEVPSLDLNFDGQASSFTRATTAADAAKANGDQLATSIVTQNKTGTVQSMYMGPDGKLIKGYVTNLLTQSSDMTHSDWSKFGSTVTSGQADPAGGTGGFLVEDTNASGYGIVRQSVTSGVSAGNYTASIFVKKTASPPTEFILRLRPVGDTQKDAIVDTQNGVVSGSTASITPVGSDWYRVSVTATVVTATELQLDIVPANATTYQSGADPTETGSHIVYGPQIEEGAAPSELVQTTSASASDQVARVEYDASGNPLGLLVEEARTNLYPGTIPTNNNITFTANQGTAPDGTNTAIKAAENSALGEKNGNTAAFSVTSGKQYTVSLFAKPNGRAGIRLLMPSVAFGNNLVATYDLQGSGSIIEWPGSDTPDATTITPAGNGWYRISITGTAASTASTFLQLVIDNDGTNTNTTYQGDGSSGLLIWGIQVEEGEGPTSLIPTTSGAVTRAADDIALATSSFGFNDGVAGAIAVDATIAEYSGSTYPRIFVIGDTEATFPSSDISIVQSSDPASPQWAATMKAGGGNLFPSNQIRSTSLGRGLAAFSFDNSPKGTLALDGALVGGQQTLTGSISASMPYLQLGASTNGAHSIVGHIRRFTYWPRAISDDQLAEYSYDLNFGGRMEYRGILSLNEMLQVSYGVEAATP